MTRSTNDSIRRHWAVSVICIVLTLISIIALGCRAEVEHGACAAGTVRVDGKPVSGVIISLLPRGKTTGPKASLAVWDGQFSFGPEAKLDGGEYQVRFSAVPKELLEKVPESTGGQLPTGGAEVHPRFDRSSRLVWKIDKNTVNARDFDIEFLGR